jgi:hypothetical protein
MSDAAYPAIVEGRAGELIPLVKDVQQRGGTVIQMKPINKNTGYRLMISWNRVTAAHD